ncbi:hypothetical protein GTO27_07515 [Candidatus Bathyarchaeota archaeon]|nr:hypothetical protein [Candidatus Bathyarchaeota archaeon]
MTKLEDQVISALQGSTEGLTLSEIAVEVGQSEKKVFKALRKLFQKGMIDSQNRRYRSISE